jgi:hypothetical protein
MTHDQQRGERFPAPEIVKGGEDAVVEVAAKTTLGTNQQEDRRLLAGCALDWEKTKKIGGRRLNVGEHPALLTDEIGELVRLYQRQALHRRHDAAYLLEPR